MSYGEPAFGLGNHRAIIEVPDNAETVYVKFPWRRCDFEQKQNGFRILNAISGDTIRNFRVIKSNNEEVEFLFHPEGQGKEFYFYYYPFNTTGGYYPTVTYVKFQEDSGNDWAEEHKNDNVESVPKGEVTRVQSINDFNSFFPMEISATKQEVNNFLKMDVRDYHVFPEYRNFPIRMKNNIPYHWVKRGMKKGIKDQVYKGEYYVFQLGIFAYKNAIDNVTLQYSGLANGRDSITKSAFECINIDGVSLNGIPFKKVINVGKGTIQPLYVGVLIPEDAAPGEYQGKVIVSPKNEMADTLSLEFEVLDSLIADHGDNDPVNLSRLRWLNSTVGSEKDFIIPPFTAVEVKDKTISVLGRKVVLSTTGLPAEINSYFSEEMTHLNEQSEPILNAPVTFNIQSTGENNWTTQNFAIRETAPSQAEWHTRNESSKFSMLVDGKMEYDGMMNFEINLIAKEATDYQNIVLEIPFKENAAKYILGLGQKGSQRPQKLEWKWDVKKNQEGVWMGNINKGLQYVLRDRHYERPLNTNFYQSKPLILPAAWYNEGKGGISITTNHGKVQADNYSGPGSIAKGDTLNFQIRFLITPFKPIDLKKHFETRFVHKYVPVDSVIALGGTVVNVHHATEINPYINYPFYHLQEQKAYIDEAHSKGVKVKIYNTIRELTYKSYELFPMRSLGYEIFNDGAGGGHPWLQEHLRDHYYKAWHAWKVNDAAILDKGTSRWTNYYIEGLSWIARNQQIDGLYLDDIAFSRETVKRMVSVLYKARNEVIIDLHSANQFNPRDGYINSAFLYMEHFPYITRLWFGEYFDYSQNPDYWFAEVSGLPFGLTGEMLQDCGRPYRGLLYGMTTRIYGDCDPRPVWKLFNEFKISDSEMLGYWLSKPVANTGNNSIRATVYKKKNGVMIVLASWSDKDVEVSLKVDWKRLGIEHPEQLKYDIPEIEGLQTSGKVSVGSRIHVPSNGGVVLIVNN